MNGLRKIVWLFSASGTSFAYPSVGIVRF